VLPCCRIISGDYFCDPVLVVRTPSPSVYQLNWEGLGMMLVPAVTNSWSTKLRDWCSFVPTNLGQRHQGDPRVDTGRGWDQRVSCISHKSRNSSGSFLMITGVPWAVHVILAPNLLVRFATHGSLILAAIQVRYPQTHAQSRVNQGII